jgi:hypothetical protein
MHQRCACSCVRLQRLIGLLRGFLQQEWVAQGGMPAMHSNSHATPDSNNGDASAHISVM